jgi:hypothetical protein
MLSLIMISVIMLSVAYKTMLNVIILSVVMLSIVAPPPPLSLCRNIATFHLSGKFNDRN